MDSHTDSGRLQHVGHSVTLASKIISLMAYPLIGNTALTPNDLIIGLWLKNEQPTWIADGVGLHVGPLSLETPAGTSTIRWKVFDTHFGQTDVDIMSWHHYGLKIRANVMTAYLDGKEYASSASGASGESLSVNVTLGQHPIHAFYPINHFGCYVPVKPTSTVSIQNPELNPGFKSQRAFAHPTSFRYHNPLLRTT